MAICKKFQWDSYDLSLEVIVPESNQPPSTLIISYNKSNQNFEIAILFSVVKGS